MSNAVLLDNITHKDLRVALRNGAEYGGAVNRVPVFATEFVDVQREYPILIHKNRESGEYQSLALLGFEEGENLFLQGDDWSSSYIPGILARGPFMIGFQKREEGGELQEEAVIHVDMDDPRVGREDGEPVFLSHGGNSPYLERVAQTLDNIQRGVAVSKDMFAAFDALGLIEPVGIQVEVHQGQKYDLKGLYGINEEKLSALKGEDLERLNQLGYLRCAFLMLASLSNMKKLIEMKRRRILAEMSKH